MTEQETPEQLRLEIGQHFMAGFDGWELTPELERYLAEYKIGNIILFKRNVRDNGQLRRLCADIQRCVLANTGRGALIAIDQEGGSVVRLGEDAVNVPGAMAVAAAGGPELAREAGRMTGRQLRALGVNFDFAPVMDVNCDPANPVIGVRSYGDTPEQVSAYGAEMLLGLQEEGVLACAKHFPGHGDTNTDSHVGLPRVAKPARMLERTELPPFARAVEAGVAGIMTAHALFPALEPDEIPATMSRRIITGLLREKLGYDGLVTTDCMEMAAIAAYYGTARGAVAALQAGADLVLVSHTPDAAKEAICAAEAAVREGRIDREALRTSTERLLRVKETYRIGAEPPEYDNAQDMAAAEEMLRRSLAGYRLPGGSLPDVGPCPLFASGYSYRNAIVNNEQAQKLSFAERMAACLGGDSLPLGQAPSDEEIEALFAAAERHSALVLGSFNGHLKERQRVLLGRLDRVKVPVLVVAFGLPYDLSDTPAGVAGLAAWEYTERSIEAVRAVLTGERRAAGRIPVRLA